MNIEIRSRGMTLSTAVRDYATRRVHFALARFGTNLHTVCIRLEDLNGPKGGVDKRCTLTIQGTHLGPRIIKTDSTSIESAIDQAADIAGHVVSRGLARARSHEDAA